MKYLLATLIFSLLISCKRKHKIAVKASWMCSNQTLIIGASGDYPEEVPATWWIYADANRNKEFDSTDLHESQNSYILLKNKGLWLSQPIKIPENWRDRALFIRVCTDSDTSMVTVNQCNSIVTDFIHP